MDNSQAGEYSIMKRYIGSSSGNAMELVTAVMELVTAVMGAVIQKRLKGQ